MPPKSIPEQEEMDMEEESFPLTHHILGLEPYILVRIVGEIDDESVNVEVETGGGFGKEEGFAFLKDVINAAEEN